MNKIFEEQKNVGIKGLAVFLVGFFLGIIQFDYFFLTEVYISSRSISFFIVLLFWLTGFLVGLTPEKQGLKKLRISLLFATFAYYLLWFFLKHYPFHHAIYPLCGLCVFITGLLPGKFFAFISSQKIKTKWVLFHENNGFVLGFLTAIIFAIIAGMWLLGWSVGLSAFLVLLILNEKKMFIFQSTSNENIAETPTDLLSGEKDLPKTVLPFSLTGAYLGILQSSVYLASLLYLSASYFEYFMVVLAWLAGASFSIKKPVFKSQKSVNLFALLIYQILLALLIIAPGKTSMSPLYALLIFFIAFPSGVFFNAYADKVSSRSLFLHENNGFIIGYLMMFLFFLEWGTNALLCVPAVFFLGLQLRKYFNVARAWITAFSLFLFFAIFKEAVLAIACFLAALFFLLANRTACLSVFQERSATSIARKNLPLGKKSSAFLMFICGFNMLLVQFLTVRQFSNVLAASELSILLIGMTVLIGYSIGYALSRVIALQKIWISLIILFVIQLGVLLLTKVFMGYLIMQGFGYLAFWGMLFLAAFCTSAPYAVLLPIFTQPQHGLGLKNAYLWNLLGSAVAIAVIAVLMQTYSAAFMPLYFALLSLMIYLLSRHSRWRYVFLLITLGVTWGLAVHQSTLNNLAQTDYYQSRGYQNPEILFSGNSFYHSVDILDTYKTPLKKERLARVAFINGVKYFDFKYDDAGNFKNETGLSEFTYYLAELPAHYLAEKLNRKINILIMGGGSLYSLKRVAPYAEKTVLVEIDPMVIESSKKYWEQINENSNLSHFEIIVDDARHYLRTNKESFDLIINDISAPYYLGTALMHSFDLFHLAKSRLSKEGLFSESTQGLPRIKSKHNQAARILKGMQLVFDHTTLLRGLRSPRGRRGYVYGSHDQPIDLKLLERLMKEKNMEKGMRIEMDSEALWSMRKVRPLSYQNVDSLLYGNIWRMKSRLKKSNLESLASKTHSFHDFKSIHYIKTLFLQQSTWINAACLWFMGLLSMLFIRPKS